MRLALTQHWTLEFTRKRPCAEIIEFWNHDAVSPIGYLRDDWHAASICANVIRTVSRKSVRDSDFLLRFVGGEHDRPRKEQSEEEAETIWNTLAKGVNKGRDMDKIKAAYERKKALLKNEP